MSVLGEQRIFLTYCALPCGGVIYYSRAFTPAALATIHAHIALRERIEIDETDAARFAANAVCVHRTIVLSSCSLALRST